MGTAAPDQPRMYSHLLEHVSLLVGKRELPIGILDFKATAELTGGAITVEINSNTAEQLANILLDVAIQFEDLQGKHNA